MGVLGAAAAAGLACEALAQRMREAPPGTERRIVERVKPRDWTLTVTVNVRVDQYEKDEHGMPRRFDFRADTMTVVFPALAETAGHVGAPALPPGQSASRDRPYITGELRLNDVVVNDTPQFLSDYPCGTRLARWTHRQWEGREMTLRVVFPVTCFQTRFDEALALEARWPETWPGEAGSCFQPQYWVDTDPALGAYDMTPVREFLARLTAGKDPRSVPPVTLAKYLAGEVMRAVQPTGGGLNFARTGELEGMSLQGAPETLRRGRGSEFDVVCVLAAVYRQAGLPARTVIGYDVGESRTEGREFLGRRGSASLRAWVEVALIDPRDSSLVWVPVDINRLRRASSRPPPLEQRWPYFGEHDELDRVIPFAFQFHPPTTVVAHGSPAFWGWLVTPRPPDAVIQSVRFNAITTPRTAEDMRRIREEERRRER